MTGEDKEQINPDSLGQNQKRKLIRENHADFIHELYKAGIPITPEQKSILLKKGYIETPVSAPVIPDPVFNEEINRDSVVYNESAEKANSLIDIFEETSAQKLFEINTSEEVERRRKDHGWIYEGRTTEIQSHEWKPKSTTDFDKDFVEWINSINIGGKDGVIKYKKFSIYCQQAYNWLDENKTPFDFDDITAREEYMLEECRRCDENVLYFLNKYIYYQEGNAEDGSGRIKYVAARNHEILCFLDDSGYSVGLVKGRQQAVTTTLMAIDVRDVIFKPSHFMKFVTENDLKAIEIFNDKLKFPFAQLPDWLRPIPLNDRDNLFIIARKEEKGKKEGANSSIRVSPPSPTVVAGGSPQKVRIDEAGNIPILGAIISNARPTMWWYNPRTKKIELKRKMWWYGTGGAMEKGGGALQTEFMAVYNKWLEGDFSSATVPIFFNWTWRPGASQKDYDRDKASAYEKANNPADPKAKQHITEFHQSWPITLSDVFRTDAKTLLDDDYIENQIKRINDAQQKHNHALVKYGYFEPIYDTNEPTQEGSDVPFKIIGAEFVATSAIDARASTVMFLEPDKAYRDRYFQGTDPIDTDTGTSKFSSTIWDSYYNTPAAILDWRIADYPQVFLQSMLMGIYYDEPEQKGIRELLESNRGSAYYQYIKAKGYGKRAVLNWELPDHLQNKTTKNEGVGIDSHGDRTRMLVNIQYEMFKHYGTNFYHTKLFEQAKTFTCKISSGGKEIWGPSNRKYFTDDELWSCTYSYICAKMCYGYLVPVNTYELKKKVEFQYITVRDPVTLKLSRQQVRKTITHNGR